jgi:hypothetical protein
LLKSQVGYYLAFACSFLLLIFIVVGGLMMRVEMNRQRAARRAARNGQPFAENTPVSDRIDEEG